MYSEAIPTANIQRIGDLISDTAYTRVGLLEGLVQIHWADGLSQQTLGEACLMQLSEAMSKLHELCKIYLIFGFT